MKRRYVVFAFLVFVALLAGSIFWPTDSARADPFGRSPAIRGRVVGLDGSPIDNVTIQAWQRGISLGGDFRTSRDGTYEIPFSKGARLDFLVFFHTEFEPLVLDNLSAQENAPLVTTLYRRVNEGRASPQARFARLEAAERLIFLALTAKGPYRYSALNTLREWNMAELVGRLPNAPEEGPDSDPLVSEMLVAKKKYVLGIYQRARATR